MTQEQFFSSLRNAISDARFEPYGSSHPRNDAEGYAVYAWNIALCESLYPALNGIEIALRNAIHFAADNYFSDGLWFAGRLSWQEEDQVNKLRNKIDPSGVKHLTAGDFVSGLSLGFWVDLFKRRYEQILWPWLLRQVFPYAPRRQRDREGLYQRLNRIRGLRNRVFHHEPVWKLPDLQARHGQILETIGWISPAMLELTRLLDRFHGVYTGGIQRYVGELDAIARIRYRGDDLG